MSLVSGFHFRRKLPFFSQCSRSVLSPPAFLIYFFEVYLHFELGYICFRYVGASRSIASRLNRNDMLSLRKRYVTNVAPADRVFNVQKLPPYFWVAPLFLRRRVSPACAMRASKHSISMQFSVCKTMFLRRVIIHQQQLLCVCLFLFVRGVVRMATSLRQTAAVTRQCAVRLLNTIKKNLSVL